ncbi:ER membrane protein complex subunit 10 [Maniola hyperantus]|uniref:ER membrane protein complex subunit 10 n=1 Tax=Aphantopus hyperantus TaxID=2795564 RepID=UPI001568D455|nr:ER membrane protein complex subunit 10 [Maniola hyperantus]
MKYLISLLFLCLFKYSVCLDYDGWINIKLEHNINCKNEKFCSRGNISLKSIRAGTAIIGQISFSKNHLAELKELADIDGFYSIRSVVTSADNKELEFQSSVKAKLFLENRLSDVISAWILPNGDVIAVTFQVNNSPQNHTLQYDKPEYPLHSNFYVRHVDQAPVPDTATYIQKLEREREAREKGDLKDNRSFLAKYWMYIVPIAIFVMISGATNPEPAPQASR